MARCLSNLTAFTAPKRATFTLSRRSSFYASITSSYDGARSSASIASSIATASPPLILFNSISVGFIIIIKELLYHPSSRRSMA
jgi:hypothetical protein